ncbi:MULTISPECIES: hypothetical protein [Paenibacillus]|uniref:hypothetical protein n=1 Tax=Paenibacillus TaxID=44249 RepID=UPI001F1DFA0D|nr:MULTISPECIES: hypothetical protein [Paenibacillus]
MLEGERYGEAAELLRFLLQCQGQEQRHYEEWQSLLDWLEAAFPQAMQTSYTESPSVHEEDAGEEDMARQFAEAKLREDADYAGKLLRKVMNEPLSEGTLLALEQLAYLEGEEVDYALTDWVQNPDIHPILQFRTLQTLRRRGVQGAVDLKRGQESIVVEIDTVPLNSDEFPVQTAQVLERVAEQTETHEPTLYYFARELWAEFIMAIYGTESYYSILSGEEGTLDLWAGALHQTVSETLNGTRNEEETRAMYGITEGMRFSFEQAYRALNRFAGRPG